MIRSLSRVLFLAVLALLIGGCGSAVRPTPTPTPTTPVSSVPTVDLETPVTETPSPGPGTPATLDLTGTWSGVWQDTSPDTANGSFTLTWKQTGSSLSGTIDIANSDCVSTGTISGSISGAKISFGAVKSQATVTFDGTINGGDKMAGNYVAGSSCHNATGTWAAEKQ